jgi:predicted acyltransferase (DUF342 family)
MSVQFALRSVFVALVTLLAAASVAAQPVSIPDGSHHKGSLESRNHPILIGNDVTVEGDAQTRNGAVTVGDRVKVGALGSRNGAISVGRDSQVGNVVARNGRVSLGAGSQAGLLEVRNGRVTVATKARVAEIDSRNGAIELEDDAEVIGKVSSRNGAIRGGQNVRVGGPIESRNGAVGFGAGSAIVGDIRSRNGAIRLNGVTVDGTLTSRSGDIVVTDGSVIASDLVIELDEASGQSSSWFFGWFGTWTYGDAGSIHVSGDSTVKGDVIVRLPEDYDGEAPSVTIDPGSRVLGAVRVDGRVDLKVAEGSAAKGIEQSAR